MLIINYERYGNNSDLGEQRCQRGQSRRHIYWVTEQWPEVDDGVRCPAKHQRNTQRNKLKSKIRISVKNTN